jgi:hypothetical protein
MKAVKIEEHMGQIMEVRKQHYLFIVDRYASTNRCTVNYNFYKEPHESQAASIDTLDVV